MSTQLRRPLYCLVQRRVAAFRVPAGRVSGWADGPTAYKFRYLWAARTLYYWVRDHRVAAFPLTGEWWKNETISPCFMNINDPTGPHTAVLFRRTLVCFLVLVTPPQPPRLCQKNI